VIFTIPGLVSVYVVEQVPDESVQMDRLNEPVLLFVVQVTVPVGLDPVTVAVQLKAEPTAADVGEVTTKVKERAAAHA
jgi:hypothetical protein